MNDGGGTVLFLPCRSGSQRVERKNLRTFAGYERGLLELKLNQLEEVAGLDAVVVDSDDPEALRYARDRTESWNGDSELRVRERAPELGRSDTPTDALIHYALETIPCKTLVWTHVTSPMFDARWYEKALDAYWRRTPDRHDSLMTVTPLRTFVWGSRGPVNYARDAVRWPRTQDVETLYEINSALFVVSRERGIEVGDRIGRRPLLFEVPAIAALDVDWEEDFRLAEQAYLSSGAERS